MKISYRKLLIDKNKRDYSLEYTDDVINLKEIKKGNIVIKTHYSRINYKDRLLARGCPGLVRRYPHTPGIDMSGEVLYSQSNRFKEGDLVYSIATPFGIKTSGGYSEIVVADEKYFYRCNDFMTPYNAMCIGTSGFTAAAIATELINYCSSKKCPKTCIITGSRSSIAYFLVPLLNQYNFTVDACGISKRDNIGNESVNNYYEAEMLTKNSFPLMPQRWSFGVDLFGGQVTSAICASLNDRGCLYSVGGIQESSTNISLLPFFLRGISIIGVNAESTDQLSRDAILGLLKLLKVFDKLAKNSSLILFSDIKAVLESQSTSNLRNPIIHF